MTPMRRFLLAMALLVLLVLAWVGLTGSLEQLPQSHTAGQRLQTLSQLTYGVFSLLGIVTTFWKRRWASVVLSGWAVSLAAAGGLGSVVWGRSSWVLGLLAAAGAAVVAAVIIWLLRRALAA